MELRAYPRIPVDLPVFFATPDSEGIGIKKGSMFNLSAGGCAVTSVTTVEVGTDIALFIQVPHEDTTIKVTRPPFAGLCLGSLGWNSFVCALMSRSAFTSYSRRCSKPQRW